MKKKIILSAVAFLTVAGLNNKSFAMQQSSSYPANVHATANGSATAHASVNPQNIDSNDLVGTVTELAKNYNKLADFNKLFLASALITASVDADFNKMLHNLIASLNANVDASVSGGVGSAHLPNIFPGLCKPACDQGCDQSVNISDKIKKIIDALKEGAGSVPGSVSACVPGSVPVNVPGMIPGSLPLPGNICLPFGGLPKITIPSIETTVSATGSISFSFNGQPVTVPGIPLSLKVCAPTVSVNGGASANVGATIPQLFCHQNCVSQPCSLPVDLASLLSGVKAVPASATAPLFANVNPVVSKLETVISGVKPSDLSSDLASKLSQLNASLQGLASQVKNM